MTRKLGRKPTQPDATRYWRKEPTLSEQLERKSEGMTGRELQAYLRTTAGAP